MYDISKYDKYTKAQMEAARNMAAGTRLCFDECLNIVTLQITTPTVNQLQLFLDNYKRKRRI